MLKRTAFIVPSAPVLKRAPPSGPEWLHEVKHDGWRAQLHRHDTGGTILSKSGKDISGRFVVIGSALRSLPPCVTDAEIVSSVSLEDDRTSRGRVFLGTFPVGRRLSFEQPRKEVSNGSYT